MEDRQVVLNGRKLTKHELDALLAYYRRMQTHFAERVAEAERAVAELEQEPGQG